MADRHLLFAAKARVLSDSPDKLVNQISEEYRQLANDLKEELLSAEQEVIVISPYYLTNSLASNNHVAVHGGYARYRRDVIRAGAE